MTDPRIALCKFLLVLPGRYYRAAMWLEDRTDRLGERVRVLLGVDWADVSGEERERLSPRAFRLRDFIRCRTWVGEAGPREEVPHARA